MFPALEILQSEDAYRRESATGRGRAVGPRRRRRARRAEKKKTQDETVQLKKEPPNA